MLYQNSYIEGMGDTYEYETLHINEIADNDFETYDTGSLTIQREAKAC